MRVQKQNNPINGIKCVVDTCQYWGQDHCYAAKIEVQHPGAQTSENTDCATFTPEG